MSRGDSTASSGVVAVVGTEIYVPDLIFLSQPDFEYDHKSHCALWRGRLKMFSASSMVIIDFV